MKDIITQEYMVSDYSIGSPREVLRKAFALGMIDEENHWLEMLRLRNTLAHDYDGLVIALACEKIVYNYSNSFQKFRETIETIMKSENNE